MSMFKSKVAKVAVIFMTVAITIVPLNAFAESQIEKDSYQNKAVYCSLECTFTSGNDIGTAITEWSGKKGYTLKTVLWQASLFSSNYTKLGMSTGTKIAMVRRTKPGVWEFMSKHYGRVGNNDKHNTKITVLSDS